MKTIKALKNFGFDGKHVEPGATLTVNPDDFGGTYDDFLAAGLFEEVSTPTIAVGEVTLSGPTNDKGAPAGPGSTPKGKGGKSETVTVTEPNGDVETVHPGSEVEAPTE